VEKTEAKSIFFRLAAPFLALGLVFVLNFQVVPTVEGATLACGQTLTSADDEDGGTAGTQVTLSNNLNCNIGGSGDKILTLEGNNIELDCGGNSITHTGASNNDDFGVFIETSVSGIGGDGNQVKNCNISNFKYGIYVSDGIGNNTDDLYLFNNTIVGPGTSETDSTGIYFTGGHDTDPLDTNIIDSNNISATQYGVFILGSTNWKGEITDNTASSNNVGIMLYNAPQYWEISGNTTDNNNYFGIAIGTGNRHWIFNNEVNNNGESGILINFSNRNVIQSNTITENGCGGGYQVDCHDTVTAAADGIPAGGTLTGSLPAGILLGANNVNYQNKIVGNTITQNNGVGVYQDESVQQYETFIINNTIQTNTHSGIHIRAIDNELYGNDSQFNGHNGLAMSSGSVDNFIGGDGSAASIIPAGSEPWPTIGYFKNGNTFLGNNIEGLLTASDITDNNGLNMQHISSDNNTCENPIGYQDFGESNACTFEPLCGDGVSEGSETCDDSNLINGDGCNDVCQLESGPVAFGSNTNGRLGDGTTDPSDVPVNVSNLSTGIMEVNNGLHSCALSSAGEVYCWGNNVYGQLGDGTTDEQLTPKLVTTLGGTVTQIAAGPRHICALMSDTSVKCWGQNQFGKLGNNMDNTNFDDPHSDKTAGNCSVFSQCELPVVVCDDIACAGDLTGVIHISAGTNNTCAVMSDTTVKCWGSNSSGQIGDGTSGVTPALAPVTVLGGLSGIDEVHVGSLHVCALASAGTVECWGSNFNGQLGDDKNCGALICTLPVQVCATGDTAPCSTFLTGITALASGSSTSCAIEGGSVKCWGDNSRGQLGNNSEIQSDTPVSVHTSDIDSDPLTGVTAISVGSFSTHTYACAVVFGAAKCWGDNDFGQLGDGVTTHSTCSTFDCALTAVNVSGLSSDVVSVNAGYSSTLALVSGPDSDGDFIADRFDNCPDLANNDQVNICSGGSSRPFICNQATTQITNLNASLTQQADDTVIQLTWDASGTNADERFLVYRSTDGSTNPDNMRGIVTYYDTSDPTNTSHEDVFTQAIEYNKSYTYVVEARNDCSGNLSGSSTIYLPPRVESGSTVNLTLNILVKIKEVREGLLLNRIQQVVEDQMVLEDQELLEGVEQALSTALETSFADVSTFTDYDQITSDETLRDSILAIEDIETLIRGHRETLILEVWTPGNRVAPISEYTRTFTTSIFGDASVTIPNFEIDSYDFTIKLPNAVRHSLNNIFTGTNPLTLNFAYTQLRFGDFDDNNKIDLEDIRFLAGGLKADPNFCAADEASTADSFCDVNGDGEFNLADLMEMLGNWGEE